MDAFDALPGEGGVLVASRVGGVTDGSIQVRTGPRRASRRMHVREAIAAEVARSPRKSPGASGAGSTASSCRSSRRSCCRVRDEERAHQLADCQGDGWARGGNDKLVDTRHRCFG